MSSAHLGQIGYFSGSRLGIHFRPHKATAGTPSMKTWVLHTSNDGNMVSGIWECSPGSYHATYTDYEYVVLIAGRIVITPDGGTPVTVKAGDAFVVEHDFKGTWEIQEHVRKHFDFRVK